MLWPFKRSRSEPKEMFMGLDLNQWAFLGTTSCTFTEGGKTRATAVIYLFVDKKNVDRRQFVLRSTGSGSFYGDSVFLDRHPFVLKYVIPWKIGGINLSSIVDEPSEWLKREYKTQHNIEWDGKKWVKGSSELMESDFSIDSISLEQEMSQFAQSLQEKCNAAD